MKSVVFLLAVSMAFGQSWPRVNITSATSSTPGRLCFYEARSNGIDSVCLQGPTAIGSGAGYTVKMPATAGGADRAMLDNGTGQLSWVEVMTTSTNQNVSGIKTFTSQQEFNAGLNSGSNIRVGGTTVINSTRAGLFTNVLISNSGGSGNLILGVQAGMSAWAWTLPTGPGTTGNLLMATDSFGTSNWSTGLEFNSSSGWFGPSSTGALSLGSASNRWGTVHANSLAIPASASGIFVSGAPGLSVTVSLPHSSGSGFCSMTFTYGVLVGTFPNPSGSTGCP